MADENILIIEDNPLEIIAAKEMLPDATLATTFSEGRSLLENKSYDGVLSDMYFDFGTPNEFLNGQDYRKRVAGYFEDYVKTRGVVLIGKEVSRIMDQVGMTGLDQYFEGFGKDEIVRSMENRIKPSYKQFKFQEDLLAHKDELLNGSHLPPMGLAIYEACQEKNIPCVIVTGDYHHGPKFQAIAGLVGDYVDTVSDKNLKGWEKGHQTLTQLIGRSD